MFVRDECGFLTYIPASLCGAEAEGAAQAGAEGAAGGAQAGAGAPEGEAGAKGAAGKEGVEGAAGAAEGAKDKGAEGAAPAPSDWRAALKSPDAKKFAESSPDVDHLVARALQLQKQVSTAIVPPGKDAKPEEISAYRKRIGVPDAPEGYKFAMPEGVEATEADKAFQATMAKTFHAANVSAEQAKVLNEAFNEVTKAAQEAQVQADKQFAEQAEAELRKAWPGAEYDKNRTFAERAATWMFGDQMEELRHLETKDGRFILDHPMFLRAFAAAGREMAEGQLIPPMAADDRGRAEEQVKDIRARIEAAQGRGDSKEANRLFQEEQRLLSQIQGSRPIVGAAGRAA